MDARCNASSYTQDLEMLQKERLRRHNAEPNDAALLPAYVPAAIMRGTPVKYAHSRLYIFLWPEAPD